MLDFIARRLVAIIPVLAVVAVFVFLMLRLTPGDPAAVIAGDNATSDQIADIREKLELTEETEAKLKDAVAAYHDSFASDMGAGSEIGDLEAEALEDTVEAAEAGA